MDALNATMAFSYPQGFATYACKIVQNVAMHPLAINANKHISVKNLSLDVFLSETTGPMQLI